MTVYNVDAHNSPNEKHCPNCNSLDLELIATTELSGIKVDIYKCKHCDAIQMFESKN